MLACLKGVFFSPVPSVVLAVDGVFGNRVYFAHIVPEDGTTEILGCTNLSPTFRVYGTAEQSRELIGTITVSDENPFPFLKAVATRASESWDGARLSSPAQEQTDNVEAQAATQLAPDPAAADAIPNQDGRAYSVNATGRGNAEVVTRLEEALRQAALDVIRDQEEHPQPSTDATRTYPVSIIRIKRPQTGRISPEEPRTLPRSLFSA